MVDKTGGSRFIPVMDHASVGGEIELGGHRPQVGDGKGAPSLGDKIKSAFSSFASRVSEGFASFKARMTEIGQSFSAKMNELGQRFTEWKAERAEKAQTDRLDRMDQRAMGGPSTATFSKTSTASTFFTSIQKTPELQKAQVSNNLTALLKEITQAGGDRGSVIDTRMTAVVKEMTAERLRNLDIGSVRQMANEFRNEGRTEKAELLEVFANKAESARTPKGATTLFLEDAKSAMHAKSELTFLRQTSETGTAAVKKMMDVFGGEEIKEKILDFAKDLKTREDVVELDKTMKEAGLRNTKGDGFTKEQSEKLVSLANEIMDYVDTLVVNEDITGLLSTLNDEIEGRIDAPQGGLSREEASVFTRRLFADQAFLKLVGPGVSSAMSPALLTAVDLVQMAANGSDGSDKMRMGELRTHYQQAASGLNDRVNDFLVDKVGMPVSGRIDINFN